MERGRFGSDEHVRYGVVDKPYRERISKISLFFKNEAKSVWLLIRIPIHERELHAQEARSDSMVIGKSLLDVPARQLGRGFAAGRTPQRR